MAQDKKRDRAAKAKVGAVSDSVLIKRILARMTAAELKVDLEIADSTIRNYQKNKKAAAKSQRSSEVRLQLEAVDHTFSKAESHGIKASVEVLRSLRFRNKRLVDVIKEHAKSNSGLVVQVIDEVIEKEAIKKPLDLFREKYQFLNDETIKKANIENPELLVQLIEDRSLLPTTRADILEALAVGAREEYFVFIKNKLNDESPHIRAATVYALLEYYSKNSAKYSDLLVTLKEKKSDEHAVGVIATYEDFFNQVVGL